MSARSRFIAAFSPPPRVIPSEVGEETRRRVGNVIRANAVFLSARRERIVREAVSETTALYSGQFASLVQRMADNGSLRVLADDAARAWASARVPGEPESRTRRTVLEAVRRSGGREDDLVLSVLSGEAEAHKFGAGVDGVLRVTRGLLVESGALLGRFQAAVAAGRETGLLLGSLLAEEASSAFTQEDTDTVSILFAETPSELDESLRTRANKITSVQMTRKMVQDLRRILREALYTNEGGALGAESMADLIVAKFGKKLGATEEQIRARAELWARTEGAVLQNDALMIMGKKAGMDGKIWQSVGDHLVRTFATSDGDHVLNDADGIIPVSDLFSDGSSDGGSGSVSPYSCRCVVGPALLGI